MGKSIVFAILTALVLGQRPETSTSLRGLDEDGAAEERQFSFSDSEDENIFDGSIGLVEDIFDSTINYIENIFDAIGDFFESCFSGDMEVVVQGKGPVPMEALQVGDYVKIGNGEAYEQVYAFGHRVPERYTEFVQIHTNKGAPLEMTGEHLVFVDGKTNPVRADSIEVWDVLKAEDKHAVVEKIEFVTRNGIYNP